MRAKLLSGADLRKQALVNAAIDLIRSEGLDAVRHSELAKMAGCTRALVYRYFPRRADIFLAITETSYAAFCERVSLPEQHRAMASIMHSPEQCLSFLHAVFQSLQEIGFVSLMLLTTPMLSRDLDEHQQTIRERYEEQWLETCSSLGLDHLQGQLLMRNSAHILKNLSTLISQGQLSQKDAAQQAYRSLYALVQVAQDFSAVEV